MSETLAAAYRYRQEAGEIAPDPAQARAVEVLGRLQDELAAQPAGGFLAALLKKPEPPPRGVYLWGPVGRGKSMLMDLFFATAPVETKRREHFYAFMAEVHGLIDAWRKGSPEERRSRFGQHRSPPLGGPGRPGPRGDDPIAPTAELIASGARLLCLDELQVADIADAMILGRLFEALFARGVVLVATSNRPPDELYQGGINRQLFLPFIDMIKARLEIVEVAGPQDHRLARLRGARVYFSPVTRANAAAFDALWQGQLDGMEERGATVEVLGRKMRLPRAAGRLLRASFSSLCGQALGSQDYLAIAGRFDTIFLEGVPRMTPAQRNEARRFVWLVDALYEARARLVVLAEAAPDGLYPSGDGAFEFERTASRLEEMRSAAWFNGATDGA
jgi:cell division protein ZapE